MKSIIAAITAIPKILDAIDKLHLSILTLLDERDRRRSEAFKRDMRAFEARMKKLIREGDFNEQEAVNMARSISDAWSKL